MFKTNEDFRKFLPISMAFSLSEVQYAINKALQTYIYTVLTEQEVNSLLDEYNTDTLTGTRANVFAILQEAIANLTIYYHTDFANIKYSEAGLHVIVTDREKPINTQEKNISKLVCFTTAMAQIENVLQKMEKNKADFPFWAASENYTEYNGNFIRNATEFGKYVAIGQSRLLFLQLKDILNENEQIELPKILGKTLYQTMKTALQTNSLTPKQEELRQQVIAYLARKIMAKNIVTLNLQYENGFMKLSYNETNSDKIKLNNDNKQLDALIKHYQDESESRLKLLIDYLNENAIDFPNFAEESKFYKKQTTVENSSPNPKGNKSFWL